MSTETKIMALFEDGNPVPDLDGLEQIDLDAAAYLATLTARSSEMTRLEEKIEEREEKRSAVPWLVAAAAVIVAGVAMILLGQGGEEPSPATTPTTVADVAPTTVVTPTTVTTTIDAAEAAWEAIPLYAGGPAGQYRSRGFEPEFAFDAPDLWTFDIGPGHSDLMGMEPLDGPGVWFMRFDDDTVDDLVSRLIDPDRFEAAQSSAVEIGGAPGVRITATPTERFTLKGFVEGPWLVEPRYGEYVFYVIDVLGSSVVVVGEGASGRDAIDGIVESIVWKDLG